MAIFRGTTGTGSSDNTIVSAVTEQAGIATTKASEASASATTASTSASSANFSAVTAAAKASEASSDAASADLQRLLCVGLKLETYDVAQEALVSANAAEASANTANSSAVQTVAGSNTQVVGVYNNIANVNTVAGVNTDVTTVAGISSDVTTVAADASDIGTVSTNIANVNNVGNNIANVNAVHGNASNINTVAADGTDIGTVATNIANVNTVAGISSTVTTVAGLESKMDTVIADASDIGAVAGNIGDITAVAGINSDVDTVAGIAAKVTTVADNITDVQNADTNAANAASSASNASASATSASNSATTATTKATEASNSATAASNSATTATTKASQAAGSATTAGTSASTATTKASEASASATTATTKAGEAASSASAASGSATTATTKAAEADVSATSAATSATKSSNAASTWNNFYNSYLGVADAQPSVDVLGNAIVAGALYYDTGAGSNTVGLYVYNGSSWVYSTNYNNVTAPYSLAQDLATNGNDINFGDNAKAKFGASNDLQIYHDGSNSYIKDAGVGNLLVLANDFRIRNASGNEDMLQVNQDGQVKISYDGSTKLVTTSTGIDVTGDIVLGDNNPSITLNDSSIANLQHIIKSTSNKLQISTDPNGVHSSSRIEFLVDNTERMQVTHTGIDVIGTATMDGLVVDGGATTTLKAGGFTANSETVLELAENRDGSNNLHYGFKFKNDGAGDNNFHLLRHSNSTTGNKALSVGRDTGDISFYEDTGTTPKFFWDASAESLGIGTTSPAQELHVVSSGESDIRLQGSNSANHLDIFHNASDFGLWGTGTQQLKLATNNTERLRIDSSGNVGIGTSSPNQLLSLNTTAATARGISIDQAGVERVKLLYTNSSGSFDINNTTAGYTSFSNNGSERMRIDSSGNVRIGTTAPQTSAKFNLRRNGTNIEFGHGNRTSGYYGTLGAQFNNGHPYMGFSCDADDSNNTFTTRGFKGNALIGTTTGDLTFNQITSASASGQTPTERMRIDSSGNVLVGTTTTDIADATSATGIVLNNGGWYEGSRDGGTVGYFNRLSSNGEIVSFRKDGAPVGSINSYAGTRLGIGSNGVSGAVFGQNAVIPATSGTTLVNNAYDLGTSSYKWKDLHLSGGVKGTNLTLSGNGSSEHARIDTSGNVLVGQTSTGDYTTTAGSSLRASGFSTHTRDGGDVLLLNRLTSDGSILQFRKDNSTVGSIGSIAGGIEVTAPTYLVLGCDDTGIRIASNEYVLPYNPSTDALKDGTVSLGVASSRFKDLYLSGGVHLGGTGSANKLDDYEEGTWTPILYGDTSGVSSPLSFGAVSSSYTKVGRLVHFTAYITNVVASGHSLTGEFRIAGLPFASTKHSPIDSITYADLFSFDETDTTVGGYVSSGNTFISVRKGSSKGAVSTSELDNSNVRDLIISGTYVA